LALGEGFPPAVAWQALPLPVDLAAPAAEVVELAVDLLLPTAVGVGREGEVSLRLGRPVARRFSRRSLSSRLTSDGVTSVNMEIRGVALPAAHRAATFTTENR